MKPVLHNVDADGDIVIVLREFNARWVIPEVRLAYHKYGSSELSFKLDETQADVPEMPSGLPVVTPSGIDPTEVRFRVSSTRLKASSAKLKAIIDGASGETSIADTPETTPKDDDSQVPAGSASQPSPPSPSVAPVLVDGEISVTGWNAYAMLVILKVIHDNSSDVPSKPSLEFIVHFTMIAEFFQFTEKVSFIAGVWCNDYAKTPKLAGIEAIMCLFVAWKFSWSEMFSTLARGLVYRGQGLKYVKTNDLPIHGILKVLDEIRQRQLGYFRRQLSEVHLSYETRQTGCTAECQDMMYGKLTLRLKERNYVGHDAVDDGISLDECIDMVDSLKRVTWRDAEGRVHYPCSPKYQLTPVINDITKTVRWKMEQLKISDFES
ncbi:hypothetical protein FLONG3_9572 [Fusarium longipes]|uniref:Uncharacterized protein n=1 Tax=Fusarium longipes TaxID=694270 RepID=A0A395RWB0_9HYPO|nr:hypothetical protein FLONG3_9572 [Fusarium longipes]